VQLNYEEKRPYQLRTEALSELGFSRRVTVYVCLFFLIFLASAVNELSLFVATFGVFLSGRD